VWSWLLPFENNSYRSSKDKEAIVRDLRTKVILYRHWLAAFFDGPGDYLLGDFRNGVFTITQKRIVGTQGYFPVVRLVVRNAEVGGTIMEARYSCPAVYAFGVLAVFMELMALRDHQYFLAVLYPILWCVFHAFGCFSYQTEKEKIDAKIREVL
jgi:hypothetical protein